MLHALKTELVLRKEVWSDKLIQTIYFGGGTPSILEVKEIEVLIEMVYAHYKVSDDVEITLEANPDDLSKEKIKVLSKTSVNRLSIGIQSFFDEDLLLMNRAHNANEALFCLSESLNYFDNCSMDLIYGIPKMSTKRWEQNIEKALSFNIPHISAYALTVEPRTVLEKLIQKGIMANVDDEKAAHQFKVLLKKLEEEGFVNYEISNFGKPNFFSKNNTAYWQGKPYLGIGPSAHSFDGNRRGWNIKNNTKYIQALMQNKLPIEYEVLSTKDRYNEYIMTGLRTIWGVSLRKIRNDFGATFEKHLIKQAKKYVVQHLLFWDDDILLATRKGKFLIDGIAANLFIINLKR